MAVVLAHGACCVSFLVQILAIRPYCVVVCVGQLRTISTCCEPSKHRTCVLSLLCLFLWCVSSCRSLNSMRGIARP